MDMRTKLMRVSSIPWRLMRYSAETPEAPQHSAATTVTAYPIG